MLKLQYLWTAILAGVAMQPVLAQTVQPRYADAVQPRQAPAVQPRHADTVQPRTAEPMQPRPAPPANANDGAPPAGAPPAVPAGSLRWSALGDSPVVRSGVGRGIQLRQVACAGVQCRIFENSAGDMVVRAETTFSPIPGNGVLQAQVYDQRMRPVGESRQRGIFANGRFWDDLSTYQLPAGDYQVRYTLQGSGTAHAAVKFSVARSEPQSHAQPGGGAPPTAAQQEATDVWRRNALCWSKTVNSADMTCR